MTSPASQREIRSAFYHRLRWLWPLLARPAVGRGWRLLAWSAFGLWLGFVVLLLALRYVVLPKVGDYQAEIERAATNAVGQPIKIGRIEARWQGLNPDLVLENVQVLDRQGGAAFTLSRVESVLSWESLWRLRPMLDLLAFDGPVLHVRRDPNGRLSVAGMETEGDSDPAFARWVLEQKHIRIRDATIVWEDQLRQAPSLVLEDLQFGLDNRGRRHRFGISAAPPAALAARLDMRGEVYGDLGEALDQLSGRLFVELDYADLAGWQRWVDYPIHLPQGRGALRVWGDLADGAGKLTADVALEEVRIRLGSKLPELDLANLRGRLQASYQPGEWVLSGNRLELLTQDGIRVAPTDFQVDWRQNERTAAVNGSASATFLDLGVLAQLAAYMPLDAHSRALLQTYRPQGRVAELRAGWGLVGEELKRYSLKAGFSGLGLRADGYVPGATGLSGRVELTEKGGELSLESAKSGLSLPAIFPEPDIALDSLKARANWKVANGAVDIKLENLQFAGPDAAGSARGTYRNNGDGPGEIDLLATVDRGEGTAVWRYMPHAVNVDARNWIRRGIVGGRGYDGRLVLKGNLKDFPFRNGGGQFLVTAKAADAKVDYAAGWPVIDDIDADMTFGIGMKIQASKGKILGARLAGVTVEIPDFESHEEQLLVRGLAQGPTGEFLRFIEQSPVADSIDRFTDGMKATGNGSLDLELDIPLRHTLDTKVRGEYAFLDNQVTALAALPPLTQVNGRLQLTEKSVAAREITGRVFGGPLKVQVGSAGDKVSVQATGTAKVVEVGKHFAWPLLDQLSGSAGWRADINIRKRNADFLITSDLLGISSPLPEPLNKNATTPLPLRIERTAPDAQSEQYRITLGKLGQGLIVRRQGNLERGVLALGEADAALPDEGMAIRLNVPVFDVDVWKNFLGGAVPNGNGTGSGAAPATNGGLGVVQLKTPKLRLFGRDYGNVEASLRARNNGWLIGIDTRDATGEVLWRGQGAGWVEGNFKRLVVHPAAEAEGGTASLVNSLPGMNLSVDDFQIGDKALGKLELKARNTQGAWQLDTLNLQNPDGALKGKAVWVNSGSHESRLGFELTARDVGKLLDRFGYIDTVRRGTAKLSGELQWNGPLTAIDYPSLTGQFWVNAEKGQFNKLEPGVGKLLGLISLQSLPRRLTLDFRDIFSSGLAFDSIEGKLAVTKGIMRTSEPLRIKGPAAWIDMEGEADLKNETQDLKVVVRPELGNAAAIGMALVNPVAGAATLLAGTVMQNPLNRLFSYRYHVTGSWSDPQVNKTGETVPEVKPKSEGEGKP